MNNNIPKGYHVERNTFLVEDGYHMDGNRVIQDGYHLEGDRAIKNGYHVTDTGKVIDNNHYENVSGRVLENNTYVSPYTGKVLKVARKPHGFPIFSLLLSLVLIPVGVLAIQGALASPDVNIYLLGIDYAIGGGSLIGSLNLLGNVFSWRKKYNNDFRSYAITSMVHRADYMEFLSTEYCSDEEYEKKLADFDRNNKITDKVFIKFLYDNKKSEKEAIKSGEAKKRIYKLRHPKTSEEDHKPMFSEAKVIPTQPAVTTPVKTKVENKTNDTIPEYLRRNTVRQENTDVDTIVSNFINNVDKSQLPILFTNYVNYYVSGTRNDFIFPLLAAIYSELCSNGDIAKVNPNTITAYFANKPKVKVK